MCSAERNCIRAFVNFANARELNRNTIPAPIPIQFSFFNIGPTINAAIACVGSTENAVGASTMNKTIPPTQTDNARNMRKRKIDTTIFPSLRSFELSIASEKDYPPVPDNRTANLAPARPTNALRLCVPHAAQVLIVAVEQPTQPRRRAGAGPWA